LAGGKEKFFRKNGADLYGKTKTRYGALCTKKKKNRAGRGGGESARQTNHKKPLKKLAIFLDLLKKRGKTTKGRGRGSSTGKEGDHLHRSPIKSTTHSNVSGKSPPTKRKDFLGGGGTRNSPVSRGRKGDLCDEKKKGTAQRKKKKKPQGFLKKKRKKNLGRLWTWSNRPGKKKGKDVLTASKGHSRRGTRSRPVGGEKREG